jgi:shikimate kinase
MSRVEQRAEPTVFLLYGPKAAGKSWVADILERELGVEHVDPDPLVLALLRTGRRPDPVLGWLNEVEEAVGRALTRNRAVATEATGAWASDWLLADRLRAVGARVISIWISASLPTTLTRLSRRSGNLVTDETDARRIYFEATRAAAERSFAAYIHTDDVTADAVLAALRPLT